MSTTVAPLPAPAARRVPRPAGDARAREVFEGVWSLRLPLCYAATAHVSAYLLRTQCGWILVDCGSALAPGWEALEIGLARAGATPDEIELLVVTHSHADHRGLAADLVAAAQCDFAMGPPPHPQIDVLRDPTIPLATRRERGTREGVPAHLLDALVDQLPAGDGHQNRMDPNRTLAYGETLETASGPWEVLPAPGHSADQIILWNAGRRVLIGADLALPGVAAFLEYGTRPDPHADQVESLTRAITLAPELLLAGHGRPAAAAVATLRVCRVLVEERLDAVAGLLGHRPRSAWELVERIAPEKATADHLQRIISETLCVLEHLESRSRVSSVIDDAGTRRWLATAPAGS
jgi:glyoxylase-like metal-dependent hydrolase (beta-lactamase superfamily II)